MYPLARARSEAVRGVDEEGDSDNSAEKNGSDLSHEIGSKIVNSSKL
jgi:hypothetical protein